MSNKQRKIQNAIVIIILVLLIIFIGVYILKKEQNNSRKDNDNTIIDQTNENEIQLLEVIDVKDVYNLEQCIKKYINGVEDDSNIIKDLEIEDNEIFYINNAYIIEINSKNTIYLVDGTLMSNKTKKNNTKLIITVDNVNETFDISLYGNKYNDIINFQDSIIDTKFNQEKLSELNETIEYQSFNFFDFDDITDEQLVKRFYEHYKLNALYFPKDAYEMIDDEYKKKRFITFESYKKYLQKFRTAIEESVLSKYSVDNLEGYTEYALLDTNQNSYFIRTQESTMNYTIQLDNYTIKSEGYEERYNNLSNENKVTTNISIFTSMINTADYNHAYKLLDDTFKKNNFSTQVKFEEFISKKFFVHNRVNIESIKKQGNYYICKLELRNNNSSASEKKELTIIMQLLEGTDFVMSFNIK